MASHWNAIDLEWVNRLADIEWRDLEQQIIAMNAEIEQTASSDPACQGLRQIPGVGPLVATAIVAAIGNGAAPHKGVSFLPGLGLCHDSTRPVVRPDSSASASAATATRARSSCMVPDPL
jgi:hypothetical protein